MTMAGEHSDRGYGRDDEAYPSSYRAAGPQRSAPGGHRRSTGYEPAGYETAGHETAGYETPGYQTPSHETPSHHPYGNGAYGHGEYGNGAYGYGAAGHEAPGHGSPSHGGAGYGTSGYGAPRHAPERYGAGGPGRAGGHPPGAGDHWGGYRGAAGPYPAGPAGYPSEPPGNGHSPAWTDPAREHGDYQTNGHTNGSSWAGQPVSSAGPRPAGRHYSGGGRRVDDGYPVEGGRYAEDGFGDGTLHDGRPRVNGRSTGLTERVAGEGPPRRAGAVPAASRPVRHGGQDTDRETPAGKTARRRRLPLWQELPLLLVIAFCLAILIRSFLLQAFFIPSGSMEDTLIAGDRVLVNKLVYNFREPARGEVVVFRGTDAWAPLATGDDDAGAFGRISRTFGDLVGVSRPSEKDYIKRVIGLPGDVVSCCDEEGRVIVNGRAVDEPYVIRDSPLTEAQDGVRDCRGRQFDEVVVQPGQMFVMGDHRQRSQDSRCQGPVPIENIIGRAFVVVWPSDRWSGLSATNAFAEVPAPETVSAAGPEAPVADQVTLAGPAGGLGMVLPVLLPFGASALELTRRGGIQGAGPARSRLARRAARRRLAE